MDTVMRDVNGRDMRKYDMYYHPETEGGIPSNWRNWRIVVRYSDDGPDYWSGVSNNPLIREGLDLAIELGYITGSEG
jgi:hypothetical protein